MRTLLNLIWLVLSGFWLAIGYVLAGIVMCLLIITIPFAIANLKLVACALSPFGREIVPADAVGAAYASAIGYERR